MSEPIGAIFEIVERVSPQRLAFDSISELQVLSDTVFRCRQQVISLKRLLARKQCTSLFTIGGSSKENGEKLQNLVDGLVQMEQSSPDFKAPLRKVSAFGERLKRKYGDVLDSEGRDYLERMTGAANRMSTLIERLLEYSRVAIRAGSFTCVDVGALIREVVSDLEVRMEKSGGRVEVSDLPVIEADPQQMRQLFQNLTGNAPKFVREEKPVVRIYFPACFNGVCRIYV